ncbi:glutamine amidotransferase [Agromyces seonyuensis]|uniref:Glutamine amidotransferase n=1 Tax=Agromyces seonyuensis TaxID=2662446 RepID=A0A6I4P879_9MICO|nr:glutamine amidotransferase [Agromyces seonyuensis]MWC00205.1 glutamine amidotransferase [Agromyces seonyuensis]
MIPFLLVAVRPETPAVGPEYDAVRAAMGLDAADLEHLRLDAQALDRDFAIERHSGIVIGGSPFNTTTPPDRKPAVQRRVEADLARLAELALERDHPVFFTCYGIGVLTEVLGGTVDTAHPEAVGPAELTLTDAGRADPLAAGLPDTFDVLVGHKESTGRLPADAVLLGTGTVSPVQWYRVGRNVYASQFHPEATPAGLAARALVYRDYGYFPASGYAAVAKVLDSARVTEPPKLLRRFAELHAR